MNFEPHVVRDQDFLDQVAADFARLSPEDRDWFDEHCHETGAPGRDRAAWLREHPEKRQEREGD